MDNLKSNLEKMLSDISQLETSYKQNKLDEEKLQNSIHETYVWSQDILMKARELVLRIQNDRSLPLEMKAELLLKQIDINGLERKVSKLFAQKKELKDRIDRTIESERKLAKLKADVMIENNRVNAFSNRNKKGWGR